MQASNFSTLFVLSREREVEDSVLDVSLLVLELKLYTLMAVLTETYFDRHGFTGLDCWVLTSTTLLRTIRLDASSRRTRSEGLETNY